MITNHCKTCRGQGRIEKEQQLEIKIPPVWILARLRLAGEADANAGPADDLYVVIHVKEHELFERQDNDLYVSIPVTFTQAVLGAEIKGPTLDGEETLTVPEGTQTGSIFRLKGKSIVSLRGHGRDDLFVITTIVTPTQLPHEQRRVRQYMKNGYTRERRSASAPKSKTSSVDPTFMMTRSVPSTPADFLNDEGADKGNRSPNRDTDQAARAK